MLFKVNTFKSVFTKTFCFLNLMLFTTFANAQKGGGLGKVNTLFDGLNGALHALAAVVVVTSITVVGFKVMFNGDSIRDCKNWIIGGTMIAGAAELGALIF